ncbi:hypothetical protein ACRAKI_22415 [Saccharothrix isguenensis]
MLTRDGGSGLLHALDRTSLTAAVADRRWPKWSTMCRLRLLGNPVLNGVCVPPDAGSAALHTAVTSLAAATGATELMVRSDGGTEIGSYYQGGNSFPLDRVEPHAAELIAAGRAVILLEPTNRFSNQLSALLRMDRPTREAPGKFTAEVLGPGYDVGDLTRGGILPHVTVSITDVSWRRYHRPWWSDLRVTPDASPAAIRARREARLERLSKHVRTVSGDRSQDSGDSASFARDWLRSHGYLDLWRDSDPTTRAVRSMPAWFAAAFLIAATHANRDWRCLATSLSDLGGGRVVYWDVVDGGHKYTAPPPSGGVT